MKTQQQLSVDELRKLYPPYTTIRLIKMFDEYAPSAGTIGTITNIDDAGTIHVKWETGSSLGLIPSIDVFEVIRYPQKASAHIHSLDGKMDEIDCLRTMTKSPSSMPTFTIESPSATNAKYSPEPK